MRKALVSMMLGLTFALCLSGCASTDTPAIVDGVGQTVQGSVATLEPITLGGVQQWILIRGHNPSNPILLKVHGGPGQAEMATAHFNAELEKDFLVVEWDQRGAGKSYTAVEPRAAMTLDQIVADTISLSELLLKRYGQKKLILVGHSWGSVVGMKAAQQRPELFHALVTTGQIANYVQGLRVGYRHLMEEATQRGQADALTELKAIGEPPYAGGQARDKVGVYVKWLEKFGLLWHGEGPFDRVRWMIRASEYSWVEKLRFTQAATSSFDLLLADLLAVDLNTMVPHVEVPVFVAAGRYDFMAPTQVSADYFEHLRAPGKQWTWFEQSAHFPQWEEPRKFHQLLLTRVRPIAMPNERGSPADFSPPSRPTP